MFLLQIQILLPWYFGGGGWFWYSNYYVTQAQLSITDLTSTYYTIVRNFFVFTTNSNFASLRFWGWWVVLILQKCSHPSSTDLSWAYRYLLHNNYKLFLFLQQIEILLPSYLEGRGCADTPIIMPPKLSLAELSKQVCTTQ